MDYPVAKQEKLQINNVLSKASLAQRKRMLFILQRGHITTASWLFSKFTPASLKIHGIRKIVPEPTVYVRSDGTLISSPKREAYVINVPGNNSALIVNADTPICYLGYGKWSLVR